MTYMKQCNECILSKQYMQYRVFLIFRVKFLPIPVLHMHWPSPRMPLLQQAATSASLPTVEMDGAFNILTTVARKVSMNSLWQYAPRVDRMW